MEAIMNAMPYGPIDLAEMHFLTGPNIPTSENKSYVWLWGVFSVLAVVGIAVAVNHYNSKKEEKKNPQPTIPTKTINTPNRDG